MVDEGAAGQGHDPGLGQQIGGLAGGEISGGRVLLDDPYAPGHAGEPLHEREVTDDSDILARARASEEIGRIHLLHTPTRAFGWGLQQGVQGGYADAGLQEGSLSGRTRTALGQAFRAGARLPARGCDRAAALRGREWWRPSRSRPSRPPSNGRLPEQSAAARCGSGSQAGHREAAFKPPFRAGENHAGVGLGVMDPRLL
jgi:hypothetical protein